MSRNQSEISQATSRLNRAHEKVKKAEKALAEAKADREAARIEYERVLGIGGEDDGEDDG